MRSFKTTIFITLSMKVFLIICFITNNINAQTISWSGYTQGQTQTSNAYSYTNGIMSATVSHNSVTRGDNSPRYVTTNTNGYCYSNGSLALNAQPFSSYLAAANSHFTVDMSFTSGGTTSGTCSAVSFTILNLNADESNTTFLDILEVSAIDGNNNAISVGSITGSGPSISTSTSGSVRKYLGHTTTSELSTSGASSPNSNCGIGQITITITPPSGVKLKSIKLKYRPAYGTNSVNAYWNSGVAPAQQYISISNLTLTPTAVSTPNFTAVSPICNGASLAALPTTSLNSITGTWSPAMNNTTTTLYSFAPSAALCANPTSMSITVNPCGLPVELTSFTGHQRDRYNLLEWQTASENNNDYFTLERSHDGRNWINIADVNGASISTLLLNYDYQDYLFSQNSINYYRLSQTDFDGTKKYTGNIVSIDNREDSKQIVRIINLLGQEVSKDTHGVVIFVYEDGSIERIVNL
jgi:hypothetical protein